MKTISLKMTYLGNLLLILTMLNSQNVHAQTTDSLTYHSTSNGAIQFQLIGGLGVYYIGDCGSAPHLRIGVDLSFDHSDQSGGNSAYSISTSTPPSSSSSSHSASDPDQTSNSYQISLSGLYLQQLADYKHTSVYCGVGPLATYAWDRYRSKYPRTFIDSYNNSSTSLENNENTYKSSSIGPLTIFGIRSRLVDHVGLSAEIGLSAVYRWTTESYSYRSTSTSSGSSSSTYENGNISNLSGWVFTLNAIRIGLVIEL